MTFPPKPTDFKVTENQVILNKPDFYFEIIILRNKSRVKVTAVFLVYDIFQFSQWKFYFQKVDHKGVKTSTFPRKSIFWVPIFDGSAKSNFLAKLVTSIFVVVILNFGPIIEPWFLDIFSGQKKIVRAKQSWPNNRKRSETKILPCQEANFRVKIHTFQNPMTHETCHMINWYLFVHVLSRDN